MTKRERMEEALYDLLQQYAELTRLRAANDLWPENRQYREIEKMTKAHIVARTSFLTRWRPRSKVSK